MVSAPGVFGPAYDAADVEALHADVLPKYLSFFNTLALDRMIVAQQSAVMACGPLASSIAEGVADRLPNARIHGFEPSEAAIMAAAERTSGLPATLELEVLKTLPTRKPDGSFTHALVVHPLASTTSRMQLLREVSRVLVPAGQALIAMPLRGSYPEITDMLREFSLKHDNPRFGEAIEVAAQSRPTPETLTEDLERLGFVDVDVTVELLSVPFEAGRDFAAHTLFRLIVGPDIVSMIDAPADVVAAALEYARLAIGKYWSEGQFDLTVNVGCASARKPS
ncbi:MAG: methyltransferase domain-containing protein [Polyangiaceae bacterium]|nr:methyltransferase domain-containing protein [Polyangiaceae bacterium]